MHERVYEVPHELPTQKTEEEECKISAKSEVASFQPPDDECTICSESLVSDEVRHKMNDVTPSVILNVPISEMN